MRSTLIPEGEYFLEFTVFEPGIVIYKGTTIGKNVHVGANTVIGGRGFVYETKEGKHQIVEAKSGVVIGDEVEIGSNCCVDAGIRRATTIGSGTKIDNLCQVGHDVSIGRNCLIAGQCGIAGFSILEDAVVLAGQVGVADNCTIGGGSIVAARSGVVNDVAPSTIVFGMPARAIKDQLEIEAIISRLPTYRRKILAIMRDMKEAD